MSKHLKPIGGYFGLELNKSYSYPHKNALHLQLGRNALKVILQNHHIKSIYAPYYTCKSILDVIAKDCKIRFYSLNEDFSPILDAKSNEWVLYTNYFGIHSSNVNNVIERYPNTIIDNAQSFFATPSKICFYSPRKFVGVSDGGLCYDTINTSLELAKDESISRARFLFKRLEGGAESGYGDFLDSEQSLESSPPKIMSNLTKKILHSINYTNIKKKRKNNFQTLNRLLKGTFCIKDEVPMIYPYYGSPKMRDFLIKHKIFVARYWPHLEKWCKKNSFELYLQNHLIALPIDQRYDRFDMNYIAKCLYAFQAKNLYDDNGGGNCSEKHFLFCYRFCGVYYA